MPPDDNTGAPQPAPVLIEPVAPAALEAPVSIPAAAPAPAPEAAPAAPAIVPHTDTATLLEGAAPAVILADPAAVPAVAAEPAKEPGAIDAAPAAEPAPVVAEPVTFEAFTLPEGVTLDSDRVTDFTGILSAADLSPQDRAQKLLDMHVDAMQAYSTQTVADQHRVFGETRLGWRTSVMADEQLGGAGHQTAMTAIARMRDTFVPEANRAAFNDFLRITGAGDHPEFLRLMHNVARRFDEPGSAPNNPKPPPDIGRRPGAMKHGGWYDNPPSAAPR